MAVMVSYLTRVGNAAALPGLIGARRSEAAVAATILLGVVLRLGHLPFIDIDLPFVYGALFLDFAEAISANGYRLPDEIPLYTDGGIPFAYPPLPFYVEAAVLDVLRLPEFTSVTLLPPLVLIWSLPAFYVLLRQLRLPNRTMFAALVAYAIMPGAFLEQVESAGLAEAFGTIAIIALAIAAIRAGERGGRREHVVLGLTWGVCVLASPGTAYGSTLLVAVFAVASLVRRPVRSEFARASGLFVLSGLIALGVSAPYWVPVLVTHGSGVYLDTAGAQYGAADASWLAVMIAVPISAAIKLVGASMVPFGVVWFALIVGGVVAAWRSQRRGVLAWTAILLLIPSEGRWLAAPAVSLLAGLGVAELLAPALMRSLRRPVTPALLSAVGAVAGLLLVAFGVLGSVQAVRAKVNDKELMLSPGAIEALEWVSAQTPGDARLIVLSRPQVVEWTPHIARRTVLNMPFGAEWVPEQAAAVDEFKTLVDGCPDLGCVSAAVAHLFGYDDIYLNVDHDTLAGFAPASSSAGEFQFTPLFEGSEATVGRLTRFRTAAD